MQAVLMLVDFLNAVNDQGLRLTGVPSSSVSVVSAVMALRATMWFATRTPSRWQLIRSGQLFSTSLISITAFLFPFFSVVKSTRWIRSWRSCWTRPGRTQI